MNQTSSNPKCYSGTKWSDGDDDAGGGYDDDDDPDEVQGVGDDDGNDFPLREGISPADFSLPESFFSLCCFRLVEAAEYFLWLSPPKLGLRG